MRTINAAVLTNRPPAPSEVPADELQLALGQEVLGRTQKILPGLAAFHFVAATSHLAKLELGQGLLLGCFFGVTSLVFVALSLGTGYGRIPADRAEATAFAASMVVLSGSFAELWVLGQPEYTLYLMLLLVGAACTFLSDRRFGELLLATFSGWIGIVWLALPASEWLLLLTFGCGLVLSGVVSFVVHRARLTHHRSLHTERLQEAARRSLLQESRERYEAAISGANDGLWFLDLSNQLFYCSPRWCAMLGLTEDEALSDPDRWLIRIHPDDAGAFRSALSAHLAKETDRFECKHRIRHCDGSYRWVLSRGLAVRDEEGRPISIAGSQTDVTHVTEIERKLLHDAVHDDLTGLPNRNHFMDRLEQAVSAGHSLGVLFIDLDRFKPINDTLGHTAGDLLLGAVAERLRDCARPGDSVARLGGDEFVFLLDNLRDKDEAMQMAAKIRRAVEQPFQIHANRVTVSASIGIASCCGADCNAEDLLRNADIAMYYAKRSRSRERLRFFSSGMLEGVAESWRLQNDFRDAIRRRELVLQFQPLMDLASGEIRSVEALVRWRRPDGTLRSPADFIPAAEETGMIAEVGEWVLRNACFQSAAWRRAGYAPLSMAVNVSAYQLVRPDFYDTVQRALSDASLPPGSLTLELTESALIESAETTLRVLRLLSDSGVGICIDDFGTGYSSLAYLQNDVFDSLKIDRCFVSKISDRGGAALVSGIISLAHGMGLSVTGEGVESPEQLEALRAQGCDQIQGFLISKPLFAEDFSAYRDLTVRPIARPVPVGDSRGRVVAISGKESLISA